MTRTAVARSRARSFSQPVRRTQDTGTHRPHAENRKAAEELTGVRSRHRHTADRDSRRPGPMGMDEACPRRAGQTVPRRVVHAMRGSRIGDEFDRTLGFDNFIRQLDRVFDRSGIERAALCGVSYGGFIALRYAAMRPERVASLVLVSSPAPGWVPNERQQQYLSRPWRSAPAFVMSAPFRLWPEIRAAYDTVRERFAFSLGHAVRVIAAPIVPPQMAARVKMQQALDFAPDCERIKVPTLIISGQDDLDQIVPAEVTRRYQQLISGARYVQIEALGPYRPSYPSGAICRHRQRIHQWQRSLISVGPAGPLEALLDEPAHRDVTDRPGQPSCSRIRTRSLAGRCTPRGSIREPKGWRELGARCCGSTFAGSAGAPAHSIRATERRKTSRPPWITWPRTIRARLCGRPDSRSARGSRSKWARLTIASRR